MPRHSVLDPRGWYYGLFRLALFVNEIKPNGFCAFHLPGGLRPLVMHGFTTHSRSRPVWKHIDLACTGRVLTKLSFNSSKNIAILQVIACSSKLGRQRTRNITFKLRCHVLQF